MLEFLGEPLTIALIGLFGGVLLGLAARLGRFCTLGAIEDALYGGDTRRLRMWALAIGLSVVASFLANAAGLVRLDASAYLGLAWAPMASVLGGLMFGYGMALAGNCGYGALARLGGGDFRSFLIVLVMGISAYATIAGPFAYLRVQFFPATLAETPQGIAHVIGSTLSIGPTLPALVIGAALILLALSSPSFRQSSGMVFWSAAIALAITSAWIGTSWVAAHGFAATPVVSHTFAAPVGETMLWVMTASGRSLSFGVGSVTGVLLGAFAGSLIKGHFRWEACEDPRELRRQISGAALMGIGAVIAIGCTVGQGLSAFSLLAFSAPVTAAAIFAGAALGLRQLITGFLPAE